MARMFALTVGACAAILAIWAYTLREVQPPVAVGDDDLLALVTE